MPFARLAFLALLNLAGCTSADIRPHVPREVSGSAAQQAAPPAPSAPPARRTITPAPARTVPTPPPAPAIVLPPQSSVPPGPVPVTGCDPGGCWGAGTRYQGGEGGAYLDKSGRLCQGNGTWMQCY
ncbi:MAG TPA: hypothetical protein VEC01_00625 [Noviherbaspirillum sp.]|uniref:hypothetical protein n=1 Tax=Noviherbaspirillum sp. TaxID=1926288 RepID=UPI002D4057A5|nr:hypothetical protein [Noviherbaspirillum sp.]HYD93796.1 hypothetical protein [Noviherbaspirillum sp.]